MTDIIKLAVMAIAITSMLAFAVASFFGNVWTVAAMVVSAAVGCWVSEQ